jgi:hypothetical protein
MKITANIDCTPEELRDFLGLPDVKPMQDEMMQEIRKQMMAGIAKLDPAEALKAWMPGVVGMDQMQDFFSLMTGGKGTGKG